MTVPVTPGLWLRTILTKNKLNVADDALELLDRYVQLLIRANKGVNLISRRDEENIWQRHILHSLSILFQFRFPEGCRVLDLGTGGGLPGIPLKILEPHIKLTMLDATKKKIVAVERIVSELRFIGVDAVWGRGEELGRDPKFKERFDVVVARGVGPLSDLVRLSHPFLRGGAVKRNNAQGTGGVTVLTEPCLVAYKGGPIDDEVEKARRIRYVRSVNVTPLAFEGQEHLASEDKKVVVVQFT